MPIDPCFSLGARGWVKSNGVDWPSKFAELQPEVLHYQTTAPLGGSARQLVIRLDYKSPCAAYVRLIAHPDDELGRINVAAAVAGASKNEPMAQ